MACSGSSGIRATAQSPSRSTSHGARRFESRHTQREAGLASFKDAVELIAGGVVELDYLLDSCFHLAEVAAAFEAARNHQGVKVQLVP